MEEWRGSLPGITITLPPFTTFSLLLFLFFFLLPEKGAFWPVYFLFFSKEWAFCYFFFFFFFHFLIFFPSLLSPLSPACREFSVKCSNSRILHTPAFFCHLFGPLPIISSLSLSCSWRLDSREQGNHFTFRPKLCWYFFGDGTLHFLWHIWCSYKVCFNDCYSNLGTTRLPVEHDMNDMIQGNM